MNFRKDSFTHPSFPQPPDFNVKVWKYLSLPEFLDIVLTESLYLRRLDLLEDNKNSTYSRICSNPTFQQKTFTLQNMQKESMVVHYEKERKRMFVNCWHLNEEESELMWKIHSNKNEGIAIQTTYLKLAESLELRRDAYLGLVRYRDFEKEEFNTSNVFNITSFKDIKYQFENEVRIGISNWVDWNKVNSEDLKIGETFTWKINERADKIYVDPYASQWYFETVKVLVEKLGIQIPVVSSGK